MWERVAMTWRRSTTLGCRSRRMIAISFLICGASLARSTISLSSTWCGAGKPLQCATGLQLQLTPGVEPARQHVPPWAPEPEAAHVGGG
jgi:hypothetical protein